ncbi:MAG: DUF2190 family protein [Arcobacteraceae bacterium]
MSKQAIEYQKGQTIDVTLDSDVEVGDIIPFGTSAVGVAVTAGLYGETIAVELEKIWQTTAATADEISIGDTLYWDDTAKVMTTVSTDNTFAGMATSTKSAATAGFVYIKINR